MKVIEVNVDDLHTGGVYSLVRNVIINKQSDVKIDIGAIEKFENPDNIEELKRYDCDVHYIGTDGAKGIKHIKCYKNFKALIKDKEYDCVHIHSDVAYKFIAPALAAKHAKVKKIIIHSHASGVDGSHRILKTILHKITRRWLKHIGTDYVTCSDLAAKWMFPNIDKDSIYVIRNGVNLEQFRYDSSIRSELRQQLDVEGKVVVGHVGRFAYQKNHAYLIRIIERLKEIKEKAQDICFLFVGEGPDEEQIRELVKEKALEDMVIFYGVSNKISELFQVMDMFVLPSHFEGLPIVGVEAQAAGLPVLFSDQITREAKIIEPVEYIGILDEDIDKWIEKINQYIDFERHDTCSELRSHRFSIEDSIDGFMNLYVGDEK